MHICVVSPGYPSPKRPHWFTFVDQLCREFADKHNAVSIIAPQSILKCIVRRTAIEPRYSVITTSNNNKLHIYRPLTISLGNFFNSFNLYINRKIVSRTIRKFAIKPDVCYAHFWDSAYITFPFAKANKITLFVATGEGYVTLQKFISEKTKKKLAGFVSGCICVSSKNKQESIEHKLITPEKTIVIPNAFSSNRFFKIDKMSVRKILHINETDFVVICVGDFSDRKGQLRLSQAIKLLNDKDIKSVFIGNIINNSKSYEPDCEGIIYKGKLPHNEINNYLNAADIFVLPTKMEGCCNAIIEAMATGLPIISSDMPFNYDILNPLNSLLVNPDDIDQIAKAIKTLKNNQGQREEMGKQSLVIANDLNISNRADKILNFINSKL
jgi:glycosyltransferase involved in cell wall biosynthesis